MGRVVSVVVNGVSIVVCSNWWCNGEDGFVGRMGVIMFVLF